MKKIILLSAILCILISGCQYIPMVLPTPLIPRQEITKTPEVVGTISLTETPPSLASATQVSTITSSPTPLPTATPTPFPILLQPGSPAYIQNFAHIDAGCNWLGIAGQIFDKSSKPIINLVVNVKGKLGQTEIDKIALTGIPEADVYGPGGYEIILAGKAENSQNTLMIQIFDINGNRLSNAMPFITYSDCKKNLIVMNFIMQ